VTELRLSLARELAMNSESSQSIGPLDAVVCDFDGVHTDDHVWVDEKGVESVRVSRSDGYGIKLLKDAGYTVLILSTEKNPVVAARAKKLGVEVIQGQDNKAEGLQSWLEKNSIDASRVAYLANDVNDIPALEQVGWPVVVADAHPTVKLMARIALRAKGGEGAVRELADLILEQGSSNS
jgi:3-deoxy-D-manno-octulosonate 8-phosphate phosphatase, YrbI family